MATLLSYPAVSTEWFPRGARVDQPQASPLDPFPQKPRGMHWRTYERLREQAHAADAEADALLAESMPGLKELLADSGVVDPAPPRPKRQRRRRDGGQ